MDKILAIQTLRSFVENTDNVIAKDAILALHPELAESEDERIRDVLIKLLKVPRKEIFEHEGITKEQAIAYLEKQKDTYSPNFPKSCSDCPTEIQSIIDKEFGIYGRDENDEPLNKCGDWRKGMVLNGSAIWRLVKLGINWHKEQKPVEWDEYTETIRKEIVKFIKDNTLTYTHSGCETQKRWIDYLEKQKEHPTSGSSEKPNIQWSEEYRKEDLQARFAFYTYKDEDGVLYLSNVFVEETSRNKGFGTKILQAAEKVAETIGAISIRLKVKQGSPANNWYRKHGYGYITFEDGYDWLEKTLEYLKPAKQEWSEEDELMRNAVLNTLERIGDYGTIGMQKDWLKSLRLQPHWKPSEEQISALERAIVKMHTSNDIGILAELRDNLKSL